MNQKAIAQLAALLFTALLLSSSALAAPPDDQFQVAARHYSRGRFQLAVDEFQRFRTEYPDHPKANESYFYLAEAQIQIKEYAAARKHYQAFVDLLPQHQHRAHAEFRIAESSYLLRDFQTAELELTNFLSQHPDHSLGQFVLPYLGEIALLQGNPTAALQHFQKSLEQFPDGALEVKTQYGLGQAFEQTESLELALDTYRGIVTKGDNPFVDDASLRLGIIHFDQADYSRAIEYLTSFEDDLSESPLRGHAAYWQGKSHLAQKQWKAAEKSLLEAKGLNLSGDLQSAVRFELGRLSVRFENIEAARVEFEALLDPSMVHEWADDSLQFWIEMELDQENYETVFNLAKRFDARFTASPLQLHVNQSAGRAHLKTEQFSAAVARFERALQNATLPEDKATSHYYLGLALFGLEQHQEAATQFDEIDRTKINTELQTALAFAIASVRFELQQYATAIDPLLEYLSESPLGSEAATCRAQLAIAYAHLGEYETLKESLKTFEEFCVEHPVYLPTIAYLAEQAYANENFELARTLFSELSRDDNPPEYVKKGLSGFAWSQMKSEKLQESDEAFAALMARHPESDLAANAAFALGQRRAEQSLHSEASTAFEFILEHHAESDFAPHAVFQIALLEEQLGDKAAAITRLQELIQRYSEFEELDTALYRLGWLYEDLGNSPEAKLSFHRLAEEFPESRLWADASYRSARYAFAENDVRRAEALANQIVQQDGGNSLIAHALYLKGQIAANEQRWQDVIQYMSGVAHHSEENALTEPAQFWVGEAAYRSGDYTRAEESLAPLLTHTQNKDENWLAVVPLRLAQIHALREEWADAERLATDIATRFPNFRQQYEADYVLGRCLVNKAELVDARTTFESVVRSSVGGRTETAAMAQWMIGETYFLQKNYDAAIQSYHRVESLFDFPRWQAGALLQAGKCYELLNRTKEAVRVYEDLLEEFSETEFSDEASERLKIVRQNPN